MMSASSSIEGLCCLHETDKEERFIRSFVNSFVVRPEPLKFLVVEDVARDTERIVLRPAASSQRPVRLPLPARVES